MKKELLINALIKFFSGLVLLSLLLFIPAGSFAFCGAWRLIAILFVPMLIFGTVLFIRSPELLKKRLNSKETSNVQKKVVVFTAFEFICCFIIAGIDYRLGWSHLPKWVIITACIVFIGCYGLYVEVMRENAYLSRTVEIQEDQNVISTGLYGIIRHPMYFSVVLLFWSMPLVLGSWPSFLIMLPFPLLLVKRILDEERILEEGLPGYKEYENQVRYRLLPFIW